MTWQLQHRRSNMPPARQGTSGLPAVTYLQAGLVYGASLSLASGCLILGRALCSLASCGNVPSSADAPKSSSRADWMANEAKGLRCKCW